MMSCLTLKDYRDLIIESITLKYNYINTDLGTHRTVKLPESNFHHLFRVMRCREGDTIIAINGDGNDYPAQLEQTGKKEAVVHIKGCYKNTKESPLHITLLQGLSKGDRMDTAIQKAVELGVNEIFPIKTAFSSLKMDAKRQAQKHQHWQSIIISACEQSERATLPTLHHLQSMETALSQLQCDFRLMLHLEPKTAEAVKLPTQVDRLAILIGPEGGFSPQEVTQAAQAGVVQKQLGQRILRTETATISALSLAQYLWGDWRD